MARRWLYLVLVLSACGRSTSVPIRCPSAAEPLPRVEAKAATTYTIKWGLPHGWWGNPSPSWYRELTASGLLTSCYDRHPDDSRPESERCAHYQVSRTDLLRLWAIVERTPDTDVTLEACSRSRDCDDCEGSYMTVYPSDGGHRSIEECHPPGKRLEQELTNLLKRCNSER